MLIFIAYFSNNSLRWLSYYETVVNFLTASFNFTEQFIQNSKLQKLDPMKVCGCDTNTFFVVLAILRNVEGFAISVNIKIYLRSHLSVMVFGDNINSMTLADKVNGIYWGLSLAWFDRTIISANTTLFPLYSIAHMAMSTFQSPLQFFAFVYCWSLFVCIER